jgi:hypothetical protein
MPASWIGHHLLGLQFAVVILAAGVAGYLLLRGARTLIVDVLQEIHRQETERRRPP